MSVQACRDEEPVVAPAADDPSFSLEGLDDSWRAQVAEEDRGTRYDAPWWYMTDAELSAAVAAAEGRVAIGFKDPQARGGVHEGVVLASPGSVAAGKDVLRSLGLEFEIEFELIPAVSLTIEPELVPSLRHNDLIDYVEPMLPGERAGQDTTWNVQRVNAPLAWQASTGDGERLLIIDNGVDKFHSDLNVDGILQCDGSDGLPTYEHGTRAAGVVAALDDTTDLVGVSHDVELWSVKDGDDTPDPDYTACGVESGRTNDAVVMYIAAIYRDSYTAVYDEIAGAWAADSIVLVAPVGNTGLNETLYPAGYSQVIGVTATDTADVRPVWATYGESVELSAPGVGITTTELDGGTVTTDGTSLAAAHVAAAAAMLIDADSSWSHTQVRDQLRTTTVDIGDSVYYGHGLLDVAAALDWTPLGASIGPPSHITQSGSYEWDSNPSGGNGTYTYQWYRRTYHQTPTCDFIGPWSEVGSDSTYEGFVSVPGYDFKLKVEVTSLEFQVTATKTVTVDEDAICPT